MRSNPSPLLEYALAYGGRGWSVVPVRFAGGKKRCAVRWKRYQDMPPPEKTLRRWFGDGKYPALAVVLGPVSGHLACRDFDQPGAYEAWAQQNPALAATLPTVRTRRGYHVYFTADVEKTILFTDGELRGARSLCVLPPSGHPEGGAYKWSVPLADGAPPALSPEQAGLLGESVKQKITEQAEAN